MLASMIKVKRLRLNDNEHSHGMDEDLTTNATSLLNSKSLSNCEAESKNFGGVLKNHELSEMKRMNSNMIDQNIKSSYSISK
jgi:spore coat protein CotF